MESASAGRVLVAELAVTGLAAIKLSVALSFGSLARSESFCRRAGASSVEKAKLHHLFLLPV